MKRIICIVLVLLTLISGNVSAKDKYINVKYIKKGQTATLQTYDSKYKVKVYSKDKTKVKYQKGLTQLVTVWFKVTVPEGVCPYVDDDDFEFKKLGKNEAYNYQVKIYTIDGKTPDKIWIPATVTSKSPYSRFTWDYYYDEDWNETGIKSYMIECRFLKKPGEKYIVGITAADKKYKTYKKMPKRYRVNYIDKWFTKHKNYTVFTKIT